MRTENPTSLLHFELGPLQSSPMCGHHSTGWAARHMHASLKVRTEFPTLILHSKLGIVVKPGRRLNLPCWPSCTSHVGADGGASRISYPVPPLENAVFGPLSLHVFSQQVGRRCGALEVHLPQDSSCSSRLATELTAAAPEFEDAAGAWSPLHAGRAARHL